MIADSPNFGVAHWWLGVSLREKHKYQQAIQEWKTNAQMDGDKNDAEITAALEAGFRSGGWPGALRKGIEVRLAQRKAKAGYVSPFQIAQYYADLGDKDHAFEWLNTAYQERDIWLTSLPTEPRIDSLRSDPRYAELVRKIGFLH